MRELLAFILAALIVAVFSRCGSSGMPIAASFTGHKPDAEAAVRAISTEVNDALGCEAITFNTTPTPDIEIVWSTEAEMAAHFGEVAQHGGLADGEFVAHNSAVSQWQSVRMWVALDYPPSNGHLSPDDIAKTWLIYVAWLRLQRPQGNDPTTLQYSHPTTNPDPVAELVREFGGLDSARRYLCGGTR